MDLIIPFSVELIPLKIELRYLLVRYLDALRIAAGVHFRMDLETSRGDGSGNQIDNHFDADQRLAAPVLGDARKQSVFDFVPLAGSRWKVADGNLQSGLIGEFLQL